VKTNRKEKRKSIGIQYDKVKADRLKNDEIVKEHHALFTHGSLKNAVQVNNCEMSLLSVKISQ